MAVTVVLSVQEGNGRIYSSVFKEAMSSIVLGSLSIRDPTKENTGRKDLLLEVYGPNDNERADRLAGRLSSLFEKVD